MNTNLCPNCRAVIPADAPGGICPSCALLGAAQPTVMLPAQGTASREEIAAAFPDLEVLEMIGQGGMGMVFKARQPRLDRLVALKILPPHLAVQPGFAERFTREARALAKLHHPHIVTVFDFGESGGYFYLLMEYVNGVNLRKAMQAGIKPEQAMLLVPRICEALQFAHDHGVLHRDIKPENILLDTNGVPKLADFGIAKLAGDRNSGLTLSGAALGTAAYMAPEQIERPGAVDHRADIYSLGAVLYEMLTGELPLGRFAAPSEKAKVGRGVDEVVLRALEKERDRRQQSATEMKTQVEGAQTVVPVAPQPPLPAERPPESGMKHLLGVLTALCGIGIPASAVIPAFHKTGLTPPVMVFLCAAFGVLAAAWPGKHSRRWRTADPRPLYRGPQFEVRSRRWLFGRPLFHIVKGINPLTGVAPVARGILAIGPVARGWLALGGRAHGVIAIGGMATGIVTAGGISVGLLSVGGLVVGLLCAVGGLSVGSLVLGGLMAGLAPLAYEVNGVPLGGRMIFGPLAGGAEHSIAGGLPRLAALAGALVAAMSFVVLICALFSAATTAVQPVAANAPAPVVNPWPRRIFWLLFLVIFGPALFFLTVLPMLYLGRRADGPPDIYQSSPAVDIVRPDRGTATAAWPQGTAELVGVSRHPSGNQPWWRMDGTLSTEEPFTWMGAPASPNAGERAYEFVFRLRDLPPDSSEPRWLVENSNSYFGGRASLKSAPGNPLPGYVAVTAVLRETENRANIKLGIAAGAWETLAANAPKNIQGTSVNRDGIAWNISQGAAVQSADESLSVTCTSSHHHDWQDRLVAVNAAGVEITNGRESRVNEQSEWRFPGLKLADVKEFRFQVRRCTWVEFRRIPLSPG